MRQTNIDLGAVQETLLIPLWARAVELSQPDPILSDPKSAEILAAIDYDFSKFEDAKLSQIGCCLRGRLLDNWVKDYLAKHPHSTIVEIGAGLNTRFERLDNRLDNRKLCWFDLDLPDVMKLRQQFFTESDRRQFLSASVLDPAWIDRVKATNAASYFFIAEGVLMYLLEDQIKQLFELLLTHFPGAYLAFDSMSPRMVKNQGRHDAIKSLSARFAWGIRDVEQISAWNDRYKIHQVCRFADLPKQLSPKYYRRFPLLARWFFSLPGLRDTYRLAIVQFGD